MQNWLNITSYGSNNNNNVNNSMSNNTSSTANDTNQATQQLWDMRWFGLLSGPLLFGTIILPLIIGPTIRVICQAYFKLQVFWRLVSLLLATIDGFVSIFFAISGLSLKAVKLTWIKFAVETTMLLFFFYRVSSAWKVERRHGFWLYPAIFILLVSLIAADVVQIFTDWVVVGTILLWVASTLCFVFAAILVGEVWVSSGKARRWRC